MKSYDARDHARRPELCPVFIPPPEPPRDDEPDDDVTPSSQGQPETRV